MFRSFVLTENQKVSIRDQLLIKIQDALKSTEFKAVAANGALGTGIKILADQSDLKTIRNLIKPVIDTFQFPESFHAVDKYFSEGEMLTIIIKQRRKK